MIYDGASNTSPMLGYPYCGDSLPPSQISSSNHLFIHFYSNPTFSGTGFKLKYNATSNNTQYHVLKDRKRTRKFVELENLLLNFSQNQNQK